MAEAGKLTIVASGPREVFEAADSYLAVLGEKRYYVGLGEAARFLKLIHQIMIAATLASRSFDEPAMSLHNMLKDLDLALQAAGQVNVEMPATARVRELFQQAVDEGLEWKDYSALVVVLERKAGV
ncbi:MAG: NAD(P)-dependent oxidoreductase [Thermoleophilia bacterium]|nr:NAD(P)-dependent oxidoreductase [Thermoleophilia bacterium]